MISHPLTLDIVRGAAELTPDAAGVAVHRLPPAVRQRFPDPLLLDRESQPSGVRVAFETRGSRAHLTFHTTRAVFRGLERSRGAVDVFVDGALQGREELTGGDAIETDLRTGARDHRAGAPQTVTVDLPDGASTVEFWLPHNETVHLVDLRVDAPITPMRTDGVRRWVHHGSSISHGSNATAPSEIWPAVAARAVRGVELTNLGFGGSAMVDPFMARVIRDTPADIISVKLGINVVNGDAMRLRAFVPAVHGFLDTIRDGHPDTRLLLISPLHCAIHEATPGPGAFDPEALAAGEVRFAATGDPTEVAAGRLTLEAIRDALRDVASRRSDDANLTFVDGLELFGAADEERLPLPDALHPGPEAHRLIGERFASYLAR
ncbi:MAG: lipase [Microbacterium sp.]|uniref:GDSL-type esterase/lipase family protein n=1 Tax=unclassified Microbacterium TaxID=2609290 RepID=UPI000C42BB23|nr:MULTISPECIES: GDSL-type esterase/lipase family protein [unclassified Microbacterium]MAY51280.1 lipase [Microbacterium sp.]HBS75623.1 lipase [Microbacterium sp.]|tara:strand:+ start:37577 stop:38707 length:1131 start_codon:yes stop_codon:yes gene_type:complete